MRGSLAPLWSRWPALALGLIATAASALCLAAPPRLNPSIERGAEVAQSRCASCHGVALEASSPSREAPLFRVLSRLYSTQDLRRKLSHIAENGHFEMPPVEIAEDEIEDVSAYIASLDGGDPAPSTPILPISSSRCPQPR